MSIEAVAWALKVAQVMDPVAKLILIGLADHAHDDGTASWPSQSTLAKYAGCTTRTVYTKLKWLETAGLIRPGDQRLVERFPVNRRPMAWDLRLEPWAEAASGQKEVPGRSTFRAEGGSEQKPVSDKPSLDPSIEGSRKNSSFEKRRKLDETPSEVVRALCEHLADRIEQNGSKRPSVGIAWYRDCRLMIDRDGYAPDKISRAIDWCQRDPFWRSNILSMGKLRGKYDQLRLKAIEERERAAKESKSGPPVPAYRSVPAPRAEDLPWAK